MKIIRLSFLSLMILFMTACSQRPPREDLEVAIKRFAIRYPNEGWKMVSYTEENRYTRKYDGEEWQVFRYGVLIAVPYLGGEFHWGAPALLGKDSSSMKEREAWVENHPQISQKRVDVEFRMIKRAAEWHNAGLP